MLWELPGAGSRAGRQPECRACHACCVCGYESAPGCSYAGSVRNKGTFGKGADLEAVGFSCASDPRLVLPPRWGLSVGRSIWGTEKLPLTDPTLLWALPACFSTYPSASLRVSTLLHGLASPTSLSQLCLSWISFTGTKTLSSAAIKGKDKIRLPVSLFLEQPNPVLLSPLRKLKLALDGTTTN